MAEHISQRVYTRMCTHTRAYSRGGGVESARIARVEVARTQTSVASYTAIYLL